MSNQNLSKVVKGIAIVTEIIGFIASMVGCVLCFKAKLELYGIVVIVAGCLASWMSGTIIYAIGQTLENTGILLESKHQSTNPSGNTPSHQWRCVSCGNYIAVTPCPFCGDSTGKSEKISSEDVSDHFYQPQTTNTDKFEPRVTVGHQWRCESCGHMISSSPCPFCQK